MMKPAARWMRQFNNERIINAHCVKEASSNMLCTVPCHGEKNGKEKLDHIAVSTHRPQRPSLSEITTAWVWWLFTVICNYMPPLPSPPLPHATLSPHTPHPTQKPDSLPALFSLALNISQHVIILCHISLTLQKCITVYAHNYAN